MIDIQTISLQLWSTGYGRYPQSLCSDIRTDHMSEFSVGFDLLADGLSDGSFGRAIGDTGKDGAARL